jgi:hypothetical protein
MFEIRFLIPQAANDGVSFLPSHHAQFEAVVAERFGGFTKYGRISGGWIDAGRVFTDDHAVYAVAVTSIVEGAKVAELVTFIKTHYGQLAVYLTYLGQAEII